MTFAALVLPEIRAYLDSVLTGMVNESDYAAIEAIIEMRFKEYNAPRLNLECVPVARIGKKTVSGLINALCSACGLSVPQMTKPALRTAATALSYIRQVTPDVSEAEIGRRAECYKRRYPTWVLSPMALAKHWGEFAVTQEQRTAAAKRDAYTEPANWRSTATRLWPGINLEGFQWNDLSITLRADIARAS